MNSQESVALRLFGLQPAGHEVPLKACCWAVTRAERILKRTLNTSDIEAQGSRLSVPLLLLASTRTKTAFKWSSAHRWFVANELLECLRDEGWGYPMSENAATHVEPVRQPIRATRSLGKSRMAAGELSAHKDGGT